MLGLMLVLATQQSIEVTPTLNSLALTTSTKGTCFTTPLQPAVVRLDWTSTGFSAGGQDYKVYRDGVLVNTTDSTSYILSLAGLVEDDTHHAQDITFNYRVDIVRASDSAVLASRSVSVTKHYGNCV